MCHLIVVRVLFLVILIIQVHVSFALSLSDVNLEILTNFMGP
jgi:hypothetical protein